MAFHSMAGTSNDSNVHEHPSGELFVARKSQKTEPMLIRTLAEIDAAGRLITINQGKTSALRMLNAFERIQDTA